MAAGVIAMSVGLVQSFDLQAQESTLTGGVIANIMLEEMKE